MTPVTYGCGVSLDYDGPVPVYRQLADVLRAGIASGEIPIGRAVPSKRTLKETSGVAGPTIDKAMAVLKDEGLIEAVPGKGLYVLRMPS